jgi:hypothetical protein
MIILLMKFNDSEDEDYGLKESITMHSVIRTTVQLKKTRNHFEYHKT